MKETPLLDGLMLRLTRALDGAERGTKKELSDYLDILPHKLSEYLKGTAKPNGETTLKIQKWLEEREG